MPIIGATPTTVYRLEGDRILDSNGRQVSPEVLESQLRRGVLQLREGALALLGEVFEDPILARLRAAGSPKPKLDEPEKHQANIHDVGDRLPDPRELQATIDRLIAAIHKVTQAIKQATSLRLHAEQESEYQQSIGASRKSLIAAGWRLAAGIVSGAATGLSGAISLRGGIQANKDLSVGGKGAEVDAGALKAEAPAPKPEAPALKTEAPAPKTEAPALKNPAVAKNVETDVPKPRRDVPEVVENATPRAAVDGPKAEGKPSKAEAKAAEAEVKLAETETKLTESRIRTAEAQVKEMEGLLRRENLQRTQALSEFAKAGGQFLSAGAEFGAGVNERDAKQLEAEAKRTAAQADQERELRESLNKMNEKTHSFFDTYKRSLSELESQAARS